jgi:hypothetical protein
MEAELQKAYTRLHSVTPSGLFPIRIILKFWTVCRVGRNPWTGDQSCSKAASYLHKTTKTLNKSRQTPMRRLELEPTIPVFGREKMFYALDSAATVMGIGFVKAVHIG